MTAAVLLSGQAEHREERAEAEKYVSDRSSASTATSHESDSSEGADEVRNCISSAALARGPAAPKLRRCLCWSAFALGFAVELAIHAVYGISESTFEAEEDCKLRRGDVPFRCGLVTVCEIICRISLTVVLCAMVWEFATAVYSRAAALCMWRTFQVGKAEERGLRLVDLLTQAAIVVFSLFIMVMGVWCALSEDTLPFWGVVVCHVCDVFCHGIILSALVGIACDLVSAARQRRVRGVLWDLLLCYDTIEAHGVSGVGCGTCAAAATAAGTWPSSSSGDDGTSEVERSESGAAPASGNCRQCEGQCEFRGAAVASYGHPNLLAFQWHRRHSTRHLEWARATFIWTMFVLSLCAAVMDSYFDDTTPEWVGTITRFEGCFCWSGIAWWVSHSVAELCTSHAQRAVPSAAARPT